MAKAKSNAALSVICTALYVAECVWAYSVIRDERVGELSALSVLPAAMLAVLFMLNASKFVGRRLSMLCGANKTNARKFGDQMWQLVIHVSMTYFEIRVLAGETWYTDPSATFDGYPKVYVKPEVQWLYVTQLAIWIITCFSHHFLEARHKDYLLM
jgi:hypothetical protein